MKHSLFTTLTLAAATLSLAPAASAITVYGLTSDNSLVSFDSAAPNVVTSIGLIAQDGIVDIDFSPVNGQLYGATATGDLYFIDTASASASPATDVLSQSLTGITTIDFNPAADRLRAFGSGDSNYRITPDESGFNNGGTAGLVTIDGTFSDTSVNLTGAAYTNNFDGTAATVLYSIDSVGDNLVIHSTAPGSLPAGNFSTVTVVGPLGIDAVAGTVGFDIGQDGVAYMSNGNSLYTVSLGTGTATSAGSIGGVAVVSIAVAPIPEPSAGLLGLLGGTLFLLRRRRTA